MELFLKRIKQENVLRIRVMDAIITVKLVYGLETMTLLESDEKRMNTIYYKGLRRILNYHHTVQDRKATNEFFLRQANLLKKRAASRSSPHRRESENKISRC